MLVVTGTVDNVTVAVNVNAGAASSATLLLLFDMVLNLAFGKLFCVQA